MLKRKIIPKANYLLEKFPVISVTGPRQSGKTTLIRNYFPDYTYYNLEMPDFREWATSDPKEFLNTIGEKVILDEIQRVPDLFSYIQVFSDERNTTGQYILSGSQNFLLMQNISQSLAGRVAILKLLPFSLAEIKESTIKYEIEKLIFNGLYPRIYDKNIAPQDYYPNYLQTYIERDVQLLRNIVNQNNFIQFVRLCAGRAGQIINHASLANDAGISVSTVKEWLSILEASYIVYFLYPHPKNYNKRLIKMPKMYFYDTGLLCYLLKIKTYNDLQYHFAKGAIYENFVINDILKQIYNRCEVPAAYFWRDKNGHEIDLILELNNKIYPIEIKAAKTMSTDYFKNLTYYNKISGNPAEYSYVFYAGDNKFKMAEGNLIGIDFLHNFIEQIDK